MDIAIIDQDALYSLKNFYPNLEAMKISFYYKKNRNLVTLLLNPNSNQRYNKIFLRKDNFLNRNQYSSLLLDKRCEYGGLSFTNNIYVPLEEEIENSSFDLSLYSDFFRKIYKGKKSYEYKKRMFYRSSFIRLSTNGIDCSNTFLKDINKNSKSHIYIYDKDILSIKDSIDVLNSIPLEYLQTFSFVYPQYVSTIEDANKICSNTWHNRENKIIFSQNLSDKKFRELCELSKNFKVYLLLQIGKDKYNTYTENYLREEFINSLNRVIYIMTTGAKIKIVVNKNIPNKTYQKFFNYLEYWHTKGSSSQSFLDYISISKVMTKKILDIAEGNRRLKELITVVPKNILNKGGVWLL